MTTTTPVNHPVDTFMDRVENFFESTVTDFEEFFAAFLPKIETVLEVAFEDLAEIAGQAVLTEATKLVSGQEKFGNAVTNVVQTIEASGKTVALQVAQTAVQTAYITAQQIAVANK